MHLPAFPSMSENMSKVNELALEVIYYPAWQNSSDLLPKNHLNIDIKGKDD